MIFYKRYRMVMDISMGKVSMKQWFFSFVAVIALSLLAFGCGGQGGGAQGGGEEVQTLKLVSFLPSNHQFTRDVIPMWIERVEKETDGAVKIERIGPEAIPVEDQFSAVRDGVADVGFNVASFYTNQVPEGNTMYLSPYKPSDERDTEYFDYISKKHEEAGVMYLGRWLGNAPFYFWTNERINTLDGFEGVTFRSNPTYRPILEELGAKQIDIVPGDVYTSLERGVVQGFGWPMLGARESAWTEVTKYIIDEPFLDLNQNAGILMNPDTFDSLPPEVQDSIRKATAEFEPEMMEHFKQETDQERNKAREAGVEFIELVPEDSQRFQDLWINIYWETMGNELPQQVDQLKKMLQYESGTYQVER
jgi:TRAP-type C4-dicarboxylate transport system substrate-binding protein